MGLIYSNISSFGDTFVWTILNQFFFIGAFLFVGWLISQIPFVKKSLIPTSLLGGLIVILLKFVPAFDDLINYDAMEIITYHCLALGFIGMALKKGDSNKKKVSVGSIIDSGLLIGGSYVVQAIIGLVITIVIVAIGGVATHLIPASGILLPLGYGQGSGQALNYGKIFETDYGFEGGSTFGLSIATIGFLVAAVVGVVYTNILRRKGKTKQTSETIIENYEVKDFVKENESPTTPSIDKMTICLVFVFCIYGLVYLVMRAFNVGLLWGFNFLLGVIFATLTRLLMNFLQKKKVMKKEQLNNYCLDRSSNFFFDVMIIAGCCAIDLNQLSSMWWQLILVCLLGAVGTFVFIYFVSKEIYKGYETEGFLSMFGMLTGTASSGMILLREVDQKYETPAANNLVYGGMPAIAIAGILLLLLGYAPKGMTEALISLAVFVAAFAIIMVALYRRKIFKFKKKNKKEPESKE
ncbi:MAG: hypothetical protein MJ248_05740 [Bacilli bacterium]|nr:hypothetical protein [Bacilli bacterium]